MSTQDTTLPPLPEPFGLFCGVRLTPPQTTEFWGMLTARETGGEKCNLYTENQMQAYARAAIAAQAQQASPTCVWIVESKTFGALYATKAEAEKYIASLPITVSGGMSISAAPVIGAQQAQGVRQWYELCPPTLELGREYTTRDGSTVRMVSISNAGKDYETMADQHGHHRYSRSHGRIIGRCTGSPLDCPGNIVFAAAPQAEPQPEREPIPRVLFDGFTVLQALDPKAKARTSSENVSDVLDAVVKIMRASACKCNGTGWVCENHDSKPWGDGPGECKCGAGKPCPCNPAAKVEWDSVIASSEQSALAGIGTKGGE